LGVLACGLERALDLGQPALSLEPAAVAAKRAAAAQDAMAGDDDRDRVRAQRVAGSARAARAAGPAGHLRVAEHAAEGDARRGAQHAAGEGAAQRPVQRNVERAALPFEVLLEPAPGGLEWSGRL